MGDERVVVDTGAERDGPRREGLSGCVREGKSIAPQSRFVVSVHLRGDRNDIDLALTLAQSLAYDNGDRGRAVALARLTMRESDFGVTVSFAVGPAPTRHEAVENLRTDLGRAALDLASRRWVEQAQLLRTLSAAAK